MKNSENLIDVVDAEICGTAMKIGIQRHALGHWEAENGSAYAAYNRLLRGEWVARDVTSVLRFALSEQPSEGIDYREWELRNMIAKLEKREKAVPVLDGAISQNGVGTYAPLAMMVLAACLFGLPDNGSGFSDREAA